MPKLTNPILQKLNNATPGARDAKLGNLIESFLELSNLKIEAHVGTAVTHYQLVDTCETLAVSTFSAPTIFVGTAGTDRVLKGTKSLRLESLTSGAGGQTALATISSADWHLSDTVGMLVYANTPLLAGDVQLLVKDNVAGVQAINLPAVSQGVSWVEIPLGAITRTAVIGYGFKRIATKQFVLWVDEITRFDTAQSIVLASKPIGESVKIVTIATAFGTNNTLAVLTADTDYYIGVDTKRLIFVTDQSANQCLILYGT